LAKKCGWLPTKGEGASSVGKGSAVCSMYDPCETVRSGCGGSTVVSQIVENNVVEPDLVISPIEKGMGT
jgi:hypothetical protein